jgi:hypothetical protein
MGGWSYAGNYGIPQAAKGTTMNMSASGDVFFSGTKYPFQAGYTVPAANVFAGLKTAAEIAGGIMGGPVGLALIVGSAAAPYLKQWFDDSGFGLSLTVPTASSAAIRGIAVLAPATNTGALRCSLGTAARNRRARITRLITLPPSPITVMPTLAGVPISVRKNGNQAVVITTSRCYVKHVPLMPLNSGTTCRAWMTFPPT